MIVTNLASRENLALLFIHSLILALLTFLLMATEESLTSSATKKGLWLNNVIVNKIWKSPFLVARLASLSAREKCLVVMRFTANLEKVDRQGTPYPKTLTAEQLLYMEDEEQKVELTQQAKETDTYELFRDDILRAARDVKWTLTQFCPDGSSLVVPNDKYLTCMSRYEDDLEQEDELGCMKMVERVVPDGFHTALYRETLPNGTKFQFELSSPTPFVIRTFHMDAFSALSIFPKQLF